MVLLWLQFYGLSSFNYFNERYKINATLIHCHCCVIDFKIAFFFFQERAELQAQLATLKAKLSSVDESGDRASEAGLRREVDNLRDSRKLLEQTVLDANRMLAEKVEEIRALQDELQLAQDASTKLQVKHLSFFFFFFVKNKVQSWVFLSTVYTSWTVNMLRLE